MSSQPMRKSSSALNLSLFDIAPDPSTVQGEAYVARPATPEAFIAERPMGNVIQFPVPLASQHRVLEDRWYQTKALAEIEARLPYKCKRRGGKGEMLVSPTGCGKTSIASRAIKTWLDRGERVLILVDLDRLLLQMHEDLEEEGVFPVIEKGKDSALSKFGHHSNAVLASMQSLYEGRLQKWARDSFDKIVIDECHEFKWAGIVDWFQCPFLGLTATPIRADGQSLKEFFHYPYIKTLTMREAIEGWDGAIHADGHREYGKPFLSRIRIESIPAPDINLSNIRVVNKDFQLGADFDQKALDAEIYQHTNFIASAILEHNGDRPAWIYCPKTRTADAIAKALRDMGARAAPYHSSVDNPTANYEAFKRGDLQYLTNVNMLIKGVNCPKVEAIWRVRASMNIAQATQEIGRGTRLSPQTGKQDCVVFEFDFASSNKKLANVIDAILDGADDPDEEVPKEEYEWRSRVSERAMELVKSKKETDAILALDLAKNQLSAEDAAAKKKAEEERLAKYQRVEVAKTTEKYDPFAGLNKVGAASSEAREAVPASPDQMKRLEELSGGMIKAYEIDRWSEGAAEKRLEQLENDRKFNIRTEPQARLLIEGFGFDSKKVRRMKKWEATKEINTRKVEYAHDLESHGFNFQEMMQKSPWDLIGRHKRFCGGAT